jgi:hypothetical protein
MVRIRHGWLVVVLGLGLVTACKKDEAAGDKSAEGASGSAAFSDDLALIPRDSEVVIGINVMQAMQSGLWKEYVQPMLTSGEATRRLSEFQAKCGVDPMTVVKSLSIGVKGTSGSKPEGVVVVHGMTKAKAMACLDSMKDDMAKDGTELSHDGDVVLIKNSRGTQVAMTYVNDSTALAVFGEQANAASVKAAQTSEQTLKASQPFLEMYKKINTGDSLWMLLSGKTLERGAAFGVKPTAVFGSFNVTDGLAVDLRVRFATPDEATSFAKLGQSQSQQAGKMFDKFEVTNDGPSDVKVSLALSSPKLKDLVSKFSGMARAFSGMGGE